MYRVTRKRHTRVRDGETTVYEPGAELEPTDSELAAFSERFERVDEPEPPKVTQEDESPEVTEEPEPAEDGEAQPYPALRAEGIDPDDYSALQSAAKDYDDIDGRASKRDLREQLEAKLEA